MAEATLLEDELRLSEIETDIHSDGEVDRRENLRPSRTVSTERLFGPARQPGQSRSQSPPSGRKTPAGILRVPGGQYGKPPPLPLHLI